VLFIRDARCASAPENEGPGDFAGQEAQRTESLGVLAAGIAHDFNNLLMGVLGNADLAMDDIPRDSPARVCVAAIQSSAKRAAEICRQLVAYSGRSTYALEPVNLSALVGDMRHLLTVSVAKTVVLRFDLSPHVPEILGDPAQLRHLVLNLVVNASDSIAGRSGVVSVTTGVTDCDRPRLDGCHLGRGLPAGRFVFIEVADTGRGMDPATLARVFDPFFTTKGAGRGLGLPAVAGIVRAHKGAIRVHSEVGRGTTFKVLLPGGAEVARSPTGDATMSRQAEACGRGKGG
jgi:signal transduction histidine kinase